MPIVPEDKDWTWVLERPCDECGFDPHGFPLETLSQLILDTGGRWVPVLSRRGVATRPSDDQWSPLEYACHVRDVFRIYDYRLGLMLAEDDPLFPNWDQDASAVAERYGEQDPHTVLTEIVEAAAKVAHRFGKVGAADWTRPGRRSDNKNFTIESFARYFIHDPIHHLWDVGG